MAYERPDEEPDAPPSATCDTLTVYRKVDGRERKVEIAGCGCEVWQVVDPEGEIVLLDKKPLSLRQSLIGDWVRAEGECDFMHAGGYVFVTGRNDDGDEIVNPACCPSVRKLARPTFCPMPEGVVVVDWDNDGVPTYVREHVWEFYVEPQKLPRGDVYRAPRIYGAHRLTCKALSLNARVQWMVADRSALKPNDLPDHTEELLLAEEERLLSSAIRSERQNSYRYQLSDYVNRVEIEEESDGQLGLLYSQDQEARRLREKCRLWLRPNAADSAEPQANGRASEVRGLRPDESAQDQVDPSPTDLDQTAGAA